MSLEWLAVSVHVVGLRSQGTTCSNFASNLAKFFPFYFFPGGSSAIRVSFLFFFTHETPTLWKLLRARLHALAYQTKSETASVGC